MIPRGGGLGPSLWQGGWAAPQRGFWLILCIYSLEDCPLDTICPPQAHSGSPPPACLCPWGALSPPPLPAPRCQQFSTSCLFLASIPRAWLTRKAALLFGVFLDEYFMLGRLCRGQQLLALSRLISEEASAEHGARLLVQTAGPGPPAALPLSEGLSAAMTSDLGGRNTPRISLSTAQKGASAETGWTPPGSQVGPGTPCG